MLICPMCKKELDGPLAACPRCQADLSLLADYVDRMRDSLEEAERLTRSGLLGEAVWAYLEVLEVEPENAEARRHVGRVAAAVRHFDRTADGRRWLRTLGRAQRWRDWWEENCWRVAVAALAGLALFMLGYQLGFRAGSPAPSAENSLPFQNVRASGDALLLRPLRGRVSESRYRCSALRSDHRLLSSTPPGSMQVQYA